MSAGTLTLTTNSDVVTGVGTTFTAELSAGDFVVVVVGGITYTLPVKSVESATKLTLVSKYPGPSQNGLAWSAVPRATQNLITAAVVAQATEALRGLNYDKQNWQQIFSGTGTITVKLPDGTTYTGPAWGGIASSLTGKMDKSQNLNDVADKAAARTNLGLGSSATRNIIDSPTSLATDAVLVPGYRGLGLATLDGGGGDTDPFYLNLNGSGFYTVAGNTPSLPVWWHPISTPVWGGGIYISRTPVQIIELLISRDGKAGVRIRRSADVGTTQAEFYTTLNTTKASDGTLKTASPVARIVNSQDKNKRKDVDEEGFTWCGCGTSNAEAEGISISRLDVGVYVLTGSAGLASEGWQLLPPMDPAGMGELGIVEAEQTESGGLTIRLFRRKYMLTESGEMVKTKGEPIDVPTNSWIDVRLDMPADSLYNKNMRATEPEVVPDKTE